jgi:hypothetical protein
VGRDILDRPSFATTVWPVQDVPAHAINRKETLVEQPPMTVAQTLEQFRYVPGRFPRKAVMAAMAQPEAITPGLLAILEHAIAHPEEVAADDDDMAPMFALYLLAQFREPRAYPLLIRLLRLDHDLVDAMLGDVITESLDRILASVCAGDIGPMQALVEDATVDEWVRAAALSGLAVLVVQDVIPRDEVIAYFRELCHGKLEREYSFVWSELACLSADLSAAELLPEIEQAYAERLCDPGCVGLDEVRRDMAAGYDTMLASPRAGRHYRFIGDTAEELSGWACFRPAPKERPKPPPPSVPAAAALKVPRNAPCPCGSGKKYKVCCGP